MTIKGSIWAPMNVFLLTSLTSVNVWRRQTLPEIVSWKVPEITFWIGKWRMLMEAKLAGVNICPKNLKLSIGQYRALLSQKLLKLFIRIQSYAISMFGCGEDD